MWSFSVIQGQDEWVVSRAANLSGSSNRGRDRGSRHPERGGAVTRTGEMGRLLCSDSASTDSRECEL